MGKEPSSEDPIEAAALDAELEAEMEKVEKQLKVSSQTSLRVSHRC